MTQPTPAPIEQIARDAAERCPFCRKQPSIDERTKSPWCVYCENPTCAAYGHNFELSQWNRRQACGQQLAVADHKLIQDVYTFVESALKVGDHSKELDFIRQLLAYIDWQKRTYGPVAGYKLVPIEPTVEMIEAGCINGVDEVDSEACYKCMIASAPTPPVQQPPENNDRLLTLLRGLKWHLEHGTPKEFIIQSVDGMIREFAAAPHPVRGGEQ